VGKRTWKSNWGKGRCASHEGTQIQGRWDGQIVTFFDGRKKGADALDEHSALERKKIAEFNRKGVSEQGRATE